MIYVIIIVVIKNIISILLFVCDYNMLVLVLVNSYTITYLHNFIFY